MPGREAAVWTAASWFTGEAPLPDAQTPELGTWYITPEEWNRWNEGAAAIDYYRRQTRFLDEWSAADTRETSHRNRRQKAEAAEQAALKREIEADLRQVREAMRRANIDPGPLRSELEHLDQPAPVPVRATRGTEPRRAPERSTPDA